MVWGAVSWNHRSDLVVVDGNLNADRYVNQILRPHVVPLARRYHLQFQQDNARPHTARLSRDFLIMHQSFVSAAPSGRGLAGLLTFQFSKPR